MAKRISDGEIVQKGWHPYFTLIEEGTEHLVGTWYPLDLSAIVGKRKVLLLLSVYGDKIANLWARPVGSAADVEVTGGVHMAEVTLGGTGWFIVETNDQGVFEYVTATADVQFEIRLIGYVD